MTVGLDSRPTATMYDIESLMRLAWNGQVRVPHFQRGFRWRRHDIIQLFDSIKRGYPVGSLLLWRRAAPAMRLTIGRLEINAPETSRALLVVDGQQRITSLANVLHPVAAQSDPARFNIAYDLAEGRFVSAPPVENPTVIPLHVLFDLTKVLGWFGRYPEAQDHVAEANELTQTLRQFQIPAYEVIQDDLHVLQDIFDRMNNHGKRLSRAEVFSALYAFDEGADNPLTFSTIAEELNAELDFGVVDDDTVSASILARRGPDVNREIRIEFDQENAQRSGHRAGQPIIEFDEDRDTAYRLGQEAMRRAIIFLQVRAGVPHVSFLPYRHLLVVLTRLFAHHPEPDERSLTLMRRWFWQAAATGPEIFRGSTTGAVRFLNYAVRPDSLTESLQELLRLVERPHTSLPDLRRFRSNEAATKIILCSWWERGPRSLDDGEPFDFQDLAACLVDRPSALDAVRYIAPRQTVPVDQRMWAADRALLPTAGEGLNSLSGRLLSGPPLDLQQGDPEIWDLVLDSHMIDPSTVPYLDGGQEMISAFLERREKALAAQLRSFLERMCEWNFENTPPLEDLVIEDLEDDRP